MKRSIGKVALISGANQGIGLATAELLLQEGCDVLLGSREFEQGILAKELLGDDPKCQPCQLDIRDQKSIDGVKDLVIKKYERLDILINNAAIHYDSWHTALTANLDEIHMTMETNLMGAWRMIQTFAPLMQRQQYGRIVNVSSGAGSLASMGSGTPGYSISKAALNALTLQCATLLKGEGILVNSVCPGWVRTQMGGEDAPRSPKEGAAGIVWAAMLEDENLTGKFFRDSQEIAW